MKKNCETGPRRYLSSGTIKSDRRNLKGVLDNWYKVFIQVDWKELYNLSKVARPSYGTNVKSTIIQINPWTSL